MENVVVVGCGSYIDSVASCPGDWKCFKAARLGEGFFPEQANILALVRCTCPGRAILSNVKMTMKFLDTKVDRVHIATCMAFAYPDCAHVDMEKLAKNIAEEHDVPVTMGSHKYF